MYGRESDAMPQAGSGWRCASPDFDLDGVVAGEAAEEGDLHVWDDGRGADYETLDADELVRVCPTGVREWDKGEGEGGGSGAYQTDSGSAC